MSAIKTEAFILKTQDYRDTSLLATFYTRDYGKLRAIVKGVRDTRGRFGSTLEPFSLNEILFYRRKRGGDLHHATQVDLVREFGDIRSDLERLSYACYFTDLLNELTEIEDANERIFELMNDALDFMGNGASPRRTARIFEVKLLELLGFMPEIKNCVICQVGTPERAFFNIPMGGVVCAKCRTGNAGFPVSRGTLSFVEHAQRTPLPNMTQVKVSQEVGAELEKTLRRFVDYHLHNKLKSVVFLEKMGFAS